MRYLWTSYMPSAILFALVRVMRTGAFCFLAYPAAARLRPPFALEIHPKRMNGAATMSDRKNNFEKSAANQPKRTFTGSVMDERGNKNLPSGKKPTNKKSRGKT